MFNLILFGPPGSGKGTQSEKLAAQYGLIHLSTGNLLRDEIKRETPLGLETKSILEKGQLVPDEVVIGMIDNCLEKHMDAKGFLFDGFPRTVAQAKALDKLLELKKTAIHQVLALEVSEEELLKRLILRGKTSGRPDDSDETVNRKRLTIYQKETSPVAEFYRKAKKLQTVKGEGTIENIFEMLSGAIDKKLK